MYCNLRSATWQLISFLSDIYIHLKEKTVNHCRYPRFIFFVHAAHWLLEPRSSIVPLGSVMMLTTEVERKAMNAK